MGTTGGGRKATPPPSPSVPAQRWQRVSQTQARDVRPHQVHHVPLLGREVARKTTPKSPKGVTKKKATTTPKKKKATTTPKKKKAATPKSTPKRKTSTRKSSRKS